MGAIPFLSAKSVQGFIRLLTTTNGAPSDGDVWFDGTDIWCRWFGQNFKVTGNSWQTKSAAFTLAAADAFTQIKCDSASTLVATVPLNSTVPFPIGVQIDLLQYGAGKVTVSPVSGSVTIRAKGGLLSTNGQYTMATLEKIGTDEWLLIGDRVA